MIRLKKIGITICVLALTIGLAGCKNAANSSATNKADTKQEETTTNNKEAATQSFPKLKGKDFDGKEVDDSIFKNNKVTVLNFWYNECSACLGEIPDLETFNKTLKEKGAEVVGVNVNANKSEDELKGAKEILEKLGATYKNIVLDPESEAGKYAASLSSFPTTVLVDQDGNIIGEPITGAINEGIKEEILGMIEKGASAQDNSTSHEAEKLINEFGAVLEKSKPVWDKVYANEEVKPLDDENLHLDEKFVPNLTDALERNKDQLTEEELKTANESLKQLSNVVEKMLELEKSMN